MNERRLLTTGIAGSTVAAICCFTPALVIVLGAVGLSAWLAWADFVLLPALVGFLGLTTYAYLRLRRSRQDEACCAEGASSERQPS
jgi:mercuric ion transport protein